MLGVKKKKTNAKWCMWRVLNFELRLLTDLATVILVSKKNRKKEGVGNLFSATT